MPSEPVDHAYQPTTSNLNLDKSFSQSGNLPLPVKVLGEINLKFSFRPRKLDSRSVDLIHNKSLQEISICCINLKLNLVGKHFAIFAVELQNLGF